MHLETYSKIYEGPDEAESTHIDESLQLVKFPSANKLFNAVFLSPPWGGVGYEVLTEYKLEHIFPEFDRIIEKATQYSSNLLIYLPKNTSIADLTQRLCRFQNRLIGERRLAELESTPADTDVGELSVEIEQLVVRGACRAIVVYTGDLARIKP